MSADIHRVSERSGDRGGVVRKVDDFKPLPRRDRQRPRDGPTQQQHESDDGEREARGFHGEKE